MRIFDSISSLIGNTPLFEIKNIEKKLELKGRVLVKLELFNPGGSIKDRAAYQMIKDALDQGLINQNSTLIEATSGNTGIGIALICASLKMKCIFTMPSSMSIERIKLLKQYGAKIVLTDASLGMSGAIVEANRLNKEIANSIIIGQFDNPSNAKAHYLTTGREIYNDCDGKIDFFISSVGSGGTITGVSKYLKEINKNIKTIAVEPDSSAVLSGDKAGKNKIQGIGAGFIPKIVDMKLIDIIEKASYENSLKCAKLLATEEGLLVGMSSGAALSVAIKYALMEENKGKIIVAILPDTGERYLSTELFE